MNSPINRRDFLKWLSLLSLSQLLDKSANFVRANHFPQNSSLPNVLILLFDSFSARHISLYGYGRETTPNLARFAQRGTVYHAHYAAGNFTTPGTASLLTGTYPWSHRAFNLWAEVAKSYEHRNLFRLLGESYNTIGYTHNKTADILLNQFRLDMDSYLNPREFSLFDALPGPLFVNDATMAYLSNLLLFAGKGTFKHTKGSFFASLLNDVRVAETYQSQILKEGYADLYPKGIPLSDRLVFLLEDAIDGIQALISSVAQPFCAYFHLMPPHWPYRPRREFIDRFNDGWNPAPKPPSFFSSHMPLDYLNTSRKEYDEYIAYADAEFGRLLDFMTHSGMLDNTILVFTSDHGEIFERGIWGHFTSVLYEPLIHIPLVISKPGQQHREDVYTPTSCVDLLPTLLHLAGQAIPDWSEGQVLPTFGSQEPSSPRSIFAVEAKKNPKHALLTKGTIALIKEQYKLIHYFGYEEHENEYELYDRVNDPQEMENLYTSNKSIANELQEELLAKLEQANQPPEHSGSKE